MLFCALALVSAGFVAFVSIGGPSPREAAAQDDSRSAAASDQERQAADPQAEADLELISALERVVERAIARAERSVVSIARRRRPPAAQSQADSHFGRGTLETSNPWDPNFVPNEFATGVVIDSSGLVLTNNHVLGDEPANQEFFVRTIGRKQFEMKVKASDATSDLAVLELAHPDLRRPGDFVPIDFGDAATLKKGQIVIALGNPYGIARDGQVSASQGIVANLSRKANTAEDDTRKTLHDYGTLIQTDARLNLGTSGGALVNKRGEMVGLTTSLAATSGFEQAAGYAIPIDKPFLRIIQTLKEGREVEYGLLGININQGNPAAEQGVQGVVVGSAIPGGPAWQAKLQPHDVITHVDGRPIYDFDGLRLHVSRLPPATAVTLTVLRKNQTLHRRTVLAKFPVELPQTFTSRPAKWRGATIDYRKPSRREVAPFQVAGNPDDSAAPCVAVRDIEEGSPAWKAGLRERMLISHVGSTPVETPAQFYKAVESQSGPITLRLLSAEGGKQTLTIPAE